MKEEKILFLLGQIATLNSNLAAKSAETSSIKRNFANIQQEVRTAASPRQSVSHPPSIVSTYATRPPLDGTAETAAEDQRLNT